MLAVSRDFERVLHYVHRWGVKVVILPDEWIQGEMRDVPYGRFHSTNHGVIDWPKRTILWGDSKLDGDAPNELLHEVGHCLDEKDPDAGDEVEGLVLAFECYSTRFLRLSGWTAWMRQYQVMLENGAYRDWPYTRPSYRRRMLAGSLKKAVEAGILTQDGKPTFKLPVYWGKHDGQEQALALSGPPGSQSLQSSG